MTADTEENDPLACLWQPEVSCVDDLWVYLVHAAQFEVLYHLFQDTHLGHTWHVLHDEDCRPKLRDGGDELAVERIARIIDDA